MRITIYGNNILNLDSFYDEIENHLAKGECPWGRNLDSLWEIIQCSFNYTDKPEFNVKEVIWLSAQTSKEKLGEEETIKWLIKKLDARSDQQFQDYIKEKIERVKDKSEKTLFEILVEIFSSNSNLHLILK